MKKKRECSGCEMCCVAFEIPHEEEPTLRGCDCPHQTGKGCGIYGKGWPKGCDEFECMWLLGGFANKDRPDLIGCFFEVQPNELLGDIILAHGEITDRRAAMIVETFAATSAVIVVPLDPRAERRIITKDPALAAKVRVILPALERYGI